MRAGLIDDFIRNSLSIPFCPCHFVHAILSNTILSVYHFVHTILSVPFCPLPFCPRTILTVHDVWYVPLQWIKYLYLAFNATRMQQVHLFAICCNCCMSKNLIVARKGVDIAPCPPP